MIRLMLNRSSCRSYTGQKIEREKTDKILTAGLLAPSSANRRPCEFIVVDDPDLLLELSGAKAQGSAFLKEAPLSIVVIADPEVSDMCVEDASIAATYMQIQIERLGLGSCWVQIRGRETGGHLSSEAYVRKCLGIPIHYIVEAIISIGYSDDSVEAKSLDELDFQKIHYHYHGMKYPGRFR